LIELAGGFHLTRIRRGDRDAFVEHLADPEIARNTLAIPFPYTETNADYWVDRCEKEARDPEILFALREPQGRLIGEIGVVGEFPADTYRAEFGYWIAKPYRGRGLMPRAIDSFAVYAFQTLGLHRLFATPFASNLASQRALEKAGFQREGLLRQHYRKDGHYVDVAVYGRIADERGHAARE